MTEIRINKFLADAGIASRRKVESLILEGKVKVNGKVITDLSTRVDLNKDKVEFNNKLIKPIKEKVVYMLNKPSGYVCTTRIFKNEQNILDLIESNQRIYPVGRLDKNTTGLILLTNDGDLALKLTHPRYDKEKEYIVTTDRPILENDISALKNLTELDGESLAPFKVKKINKNKLSIILTEGKYRQIRKMMQLIGYSYVDLHRIRINDITLGNLKEGEYKIIKIKL